MISSDKIFVTGIGTNVGKTFTSACICKQFGYDYWKPVQSGSFPQTDSQFIQTHTPKTKIFNESFVFKKPASPHDAAKEEKINISMFDFVLPNSNRLIIEGAGGLCVPLNDQITVFDLSQKWDLPIILVIRDYLGCINHTMLSVAYLFNKSIKIEALVLNGHFNKETKSYFLKQLQHFPFYELPEWDGVSKLPSLKKENK